jgi:TfoX/Sxy family transcriptional regulator of competence genes
MAYNEALAARLRAALAGEPGAAEKRMFGGLAMLVDGAMAVGVYGDDLLVRIDPAEREAVLAQPEVAEFQMGPHTPKGFVLVRADAVARDRQLAAWVRRGVGYARSLPAK